MSDHENEIAGLHLFDGSSIAAIGFDLQKQAVYSNAAADLLVGLASRLLENGDSEFEFGPGIWLAIDRIAFPGGTLCLCRDISVLQKELELGRTAARFAHDLNNLLALIGGYAQLAQRSPTPDKIAVYLEEILKSTARAAALTEQILARKRALQRAAS